MATGEFELIRRYFERPPRRALLGVGDDCALIAARFPDRLGSPTGAGAAIADPSFTDSALAVTTDMLVAGRHFFPDVSPRSLGHKALAVNLSDLAAMGAEPLGFTLALALPEVNEAWIEEFARGLLDLADAADCELLGGDTTRGPLTLSITALGRVLTSQALRRDAAQAGDDVWVSGALGAAAYAVREALAGRALAPGHAAREQMERPQPRIAVGRALLGFAHAAIDVSDGLVADLGHICERSAVGAELDWSSIPVDSSLASLAEAERQALALAGGDDYELLFSAPTEHRAQIDSVAARCGVPLTRIGKIVSGAGVRVQDASGRSINIGRGGFDHFA
jgi:thiamine-monophosphate kinase